MDVEVRLAPENVSPSVRRLVEIALLQPGLDIGRGDRRQVEIELDADDRVVGFFFHTRTGAGRFDDQPVDWNV